MITQIAIGETTGKIYARGTHAECSRRLNRTKQFLKEPIRIVKASREYEILEEQIKRTVPVKSEKSKPYKIAWTKEMNDFVLENDHLNIAELTEKFNTHFNTNTTKPSINSRRTSLRSGVVRVTIDWSKAHEAFLLENYWKLSMSEIAEHVGRSKNTVNAKANRMGLRRVVKSE